MMINNSNTSTSSSNTGISLGSTELQPPLFKLVKRLKWPKLTELLKVKKNHASCKERDETGLTLLGISLGYHAPLDIIKLIHSIDPSQLTALDMFGANALHIGCLNGNHPNVIAFLLQQNSALASSRDKDHRTPLHQITECICRDEIHLKEGLKVIDIICRYDCTMIHASDLNGNAPVDVVHIATIAGQRTMNESEIKRLKMTCRFLRKISFKVYKLQKEAWENKTSLDHKSFSASKSFITSSTKSSAASHARSYGDSTMGRFLSQEEESEGEDG